MSQQLKGNLSGLAPSELKKLQRIFNRRIGKDEIIPLDFAREIYSAASELRRKVGVLVSREGRIEEVFVGNKNIIYLPDLGRYRLGRGRLRRLRLLFTDLSPSADEVRIPNDIYTDLEKLRLDMVAGIKPAKNRMLMSYAHIMPGEDGGPSVNTETVRDLGAFDFDFSGFMSELEDELSSADAVSHAAAKDSAVLVGVYDKNHPDVEGSMEELSELARTAGVKVLEKIIQKRNLDPKTLLGKGKLEEVVLTCLRHGAEMIIFDAELKPSQWRAITNSTELKVLDRSMLILDIFSQRATSSDGRLQVELAQLKYNLPRLVEKDAGLSRLTGGIGGRGPGETKLEIGRRRIRDRIIDLEARIDKLGSQRSLRRNRRMENKVPQVSILGYTNVGKSTLFNALTGSSVVAENKLFATLDPAQRRVGLADPKTGAVTGVVMSDTVGFIRDLPDELRTAFRATLEELKDATLLLHVLDVSDPRIAERKEAVEKVLNEMDLTDLPVQVVLNKCDKADPETAAALAREFDAVPVSAVKREGLALLKERILKRIASVRREEEEERARESEYRSDLGDFAD